MSRVHLITHLILPKSIMNTHDNLMPINVNMPLHQRHRLGEDIIASSNEVDIHDLMIAHDAEYTLIVVLGQLGVEFYYNSCL